MRTPHLADLVIAARARLAPGGASARIEMRRRGLTLLTMLVWMVLMTVLLAGTAAVGWAWWAL